MGIRAYLPGAQFSMLMVSLFFSVGLIYAAQQYAYPTQNSAQLAVGVNTVANSNWQGAFASSTLLKQDSAIASEAQALVAASKTDNLTESVAHQLVINAAAATGQGLSGNATEENSIVNSAISQIQTSEATTTAYTASDFIAIPNTPSSLRTYANGLASLTSAFPQANYEAVMVASGLAVDYQNTPLANLLSAAATEYRTMAKVLEKSPTPQALLGVAVETSNIYLQMAAACDDISHVLTDQLKGISGLQAYQTLNGRGVETFTNLAQILQAEGITFQKTEPGTIWASFLNNQTPSTAQAAGAFSS